MSNRQVFTSSGTWTVPTGVTSVDVVVIGGGGGGGGAGSVGGGGGAGAVVQQTAVSVTPGSGVTVTVGAGGAGRMPQVDGAGPGAVGGQSAFGTVTAAGGGGGGGGASGPPSSGGCGGGGVRGEAGAAGTVGGNGGAGYTATADQGGGGGGGMGGNGGDAVFRDSGDGGPGINLSALLGTDLGVSGWFAGGGGGGVRLQSGATAGAGGSGGGGAGSGGNLVHATAGTAGTGSGGGGGGSQANGSGTSAGNGGNGGSGLVVVLWEDPAPVEEAQGSAAGTWVWAGAAEGVAPGAVATVQVSGASGASLTDPVRRAGKGQRRVWWTGTRWDGLLPTSSGWRFYTGLAGTPTQGAVVDSRQAARPTVVQHGTTVWVLSGHPSAPRVSRYVRSGTTYTADLTDVALPSALAASDGDASPLTAHRTPNGRLWAANITGGQVVVAVSDNDGATWTATNLVSASDTGVATLATVGTDVLLGVQLNSGAGRSVRRHSQDGSLASGWTTETLPALPSGVVSDDHGQMVSDGADLYWASKTELADASDEPLIYLLHRAPAGTWTAHTIVPGPDTGSRASRPTLALTGGLLHIFVGHIGSPTSTAYTTRARNDLGAASSFTNLFTGGDFSDGAMTPDGVLGPDSGILLLGHDRATGSGAIWRAVLPVAAPPSGSASGTWAWAGQAAGARSASGAAAGSHGWAGQAQGSTTRTGSASGGYGWSGGATGAHQARGEATGGHGWAGTASGTTTRRGTAAGALGWAGTAAGVTPDVDSASGTATGTYAWAGTAQGHRNASGTATGAYGWAGQAQGARTARGAPSGTYGWIGTANGSAPDPEARTGTAAGAHGWTGAATGRRHPKATTAGTYGWAGTATGATPRTGTATGGYAWQGTATGRGDGYRDITLTLGALTAHPLTAGNLTGHPLRVTALRTHPLTVTALEV